MPHEIDRSLCRERVCGVFREVLRFAIDGWRILRESTFSEEMGATECVLLLHKNKHVMLEEKCGVLWHES